MTTYTLPILYGLDKAGKEREWTISVIGNITTKTHGLVTGKKIVTERSFKGVNIGRKNETTAEEQARLQAQRDWIKQLDKSYKPKTKEGLVMYNRIITDKATSGGNNHAVNFIDSKPSRIAPKVLSRDNGSASNVDNQIFPMKCQVWERKNGIVLPKVLKHFDMEQGVYVQAKLDGVRCTATVQSDGDVVLLSNTSKQFLWHAELRKKIRQLIGDRDIILDGELYAHSIIDEKERELTHDERFGVITSACRSVRGVPSEYENQICYYVFDIVDTKLDQDNRFKLLNEVFNEWSDNRIVRVESPIVHTTKEVCDYHDKMAYQGFEGVVIRARDLVYRHKHRSLKMRKYKNFQDAEFRVIGIELDQGVDKEYFVWWCVTTNGAKFKAKPRGTREMKQMWYDNSDSYMGEMLTVKYQELTPDRIPRFPIAIRFRSREDHGHE